MKELKEAFLDAVSDYIALCDKLNKPTLKSYRGNFNIRIAPERHKKAVQKSLLLGISLNQLVQKAIEKEVKSLDISDAQLDYVLQKLNRRDCPGIG